METDGDVVFTSGGEGRRSMSFVAVDRSRYTFIDEGEVLSDKEHFIYIGPRPSSVVRYNCYKNIQNMAVLRESSSLSPSPPSPARPTTPRFF